jgi:hypothetical protein
LALLLALLLELQLGLTARQWDLQSGSKLGRELELQSGRELGPLLAGELGEKLLLGCQ